jgi:putative phosphoesterase
LSGLRLAILADTHMPRGGRRLPDACVEELRAADLIVHLGDFSTMQVLRELREHAPVAAAVHGNVDSAELRRHLPERATVELEGARIGLVHDAGPARGRLARLRTEFPEADVVLFGHSHVSLHERSPGFQIFNPGSPTERRRSPTRSMGIAQINGGDVRLRHVAFG